MSILKSLVMFWFRQKSWVKIVVGMILGMILGFSFGEKVAVLRPIGTVFINSFMMMVVPVIFVSLVCGIISMKDPAKMGRIAAKTFAIYFTTMSLGTTIALFLSSVVFDVGKGVQLASLGAQAVDIPAARSLGFVDTLVNIVPSNILVSFSEANVLQVIFFSILFGISINFSGAAAKPVEDFFNALSAVIFKFVNIIMGFAPYGICALMAVLTGTQGLDVIKALMKMVGVIYICFFVVMATIYGSGLTIARLNPLQFFKKMLEAQVVAFSTTSSAAALPVNMKVAENKLGVERGIVGFVLPLGSTVNMDGLSTYLGVIAVFAANLYGIELSISDMITIVFTSTLAAIGCAGVPAAGLIVLPMVLSSVGIPLDVVGMIAAVTRIIEMMSTTMNITGDTFAAVIVAKSENELSLDVYNDDHASSDMGSSLLKTKEYSPA